MAKKRRKRKHQKLDDSFYAAGERGPVSKAYFKQMARKLPGEVHERIKQKKTEFNRLAHKYFKRVQRTLAQRKWEAATTLALEDYWASQYAVKALGAEFEWAKTILDEHKKYGLIVEFDPADLGWAYNRIVEAPKAERAEQIKAGKKAREYKRILSSWDFLWKQTLKRVLKNYPFSRKLRGIRKNLKEAEAAVEKSEKELHRLIGVKIQLLQSKAILKESFDNALKTMQIPLNKKSVKYYSLLEDWWAFWYRFVTQTDMMVSKSFVDEIARRKHNATIEKIKVMRALKK